MTALVDRTGLAFHRTQMRRRIAKGGSALMDMVRKGKRIKEDGEGSRTPRDSRSDTLIDGEAGREESTETEEVTDAHFHRHKP